MKQFMARIMIMLFLFNLIFFLAYHKSNVIAVNLKNEFPPFVVYGRMEVDYGILKKGDIVEVNYGAKKSYYVVGFNSKRMIVPYYYLSVLTDTFLKVNDVTKEDITRYINLTRLKSATNYLVFVDLYRNMVNIFHEVGDKYQLIRSIKCSSGSLAYPTPRGVFYIKDKYKAIGKEGEYTCLYATQFFNDYLFHSVLLDYETLEVIDGRLDERISYGCIRIPLKDALFIFQTIPQNTLVYIN